MGAMSKRLRAPAVAGSLVIAAALLIPAAPVAATASDCNALTLNLLANCGFESAGASWSLTGDTAGAGATSGSARTGVAGFQAGPAFPTDGTTLSQTVATTVGHAYALKLWFNAAHLSTPGAAMGFTTEVYDGSTNAAGFGLEPTTTGWQTNTLAWIAKSTTATVEFTFWGGVDGIWYLDDLVLEQVPDMTGTTATKSKGKVTIDLASLASWTSAECMFPGRNAAWQTCTDGQTVKTSAKYMLVRASNGEMWGPAVTVYVTRP